MLANRLRNRVQIQSLTVGIDSADGAQNETWNVLASAVPAEIIPLSGRELIAAQAVQSVIDTKITMRYRSDLTESMRIVHESVSYDIKAILPDPSMRRYITVMCEANIAESSEFVISGYDYGSITEPVGASKDNGGL